MYAYAYLRRTSGKFNAVRAAAFTIRSFFAPTVWCRSDRCHTRVSAVVNLDRLDDRLHRGGDDLGVRISDNDVAVALVAVAARCARLRKARLDDEAADQLLRAIDPGDPQHASAHDTAQVRAGDGVPAGVRAVERIVDDRARPAAIHVGVVRQSGHPHDVGSRGPRRDLADRERAIV